MANLDRPDPAPQTDINRTPAFPRLDATRASSERSARLDQAERAFVLLRDRMYECTNKQTSALIASAETAEVLATAAMTLCSTEINASVQAILAKSALEGASFDSETMRAELVKVVRQNVVTTAVQMRALANTSASSSAPSAHSTPAINTLPAGRNY